MNKFSLCLSFVLGVAMLPQVHAADGAYLPPQPSGSSPNACELILEPGLRAPSEALIGANLASILNQPRVAIINADASPRAAGLMGLPHGLERFNVQVTEGSPYPMLYWVHLEDPRSGFRRSFALRGRDMTVWKQIPQEGDFYFDYALDDEDLKDLSFGNLLEVGDDERGFVSIDVQNGMVRIALGIDVPCATAIDYTTAISSPKIVIANGAILCRVEVLAARFRTND